MLKILNRKSKVIILEPGDATHYEFDVGKSTTIGEENYITVSNLNYGIKFNSYSFHKSHILNFFEFVGKPPRMKKDYRIWANKAIQDSYLEYVINHTGKSNPYTALAAMISCLIYLDPSTKLGIE